ncbi:MAG TPA: hypothetical protein VI032_09850 [Burkholderiaceae bacterium]
MTARHATRRSWSVIVLAAALGLAGAAHAQQPRAAAAPASPEAQQRLAQARQRLQLTPEQESKLRALLQDEAHKLRAIRDKYANDNSLQARGARSRELSALQEDFHTKLQGVLSPAQVDEWDKMAAERRAQARERQRQPP